MTFDDALLRKAVITNPAAAVRRKLTTIAKRKRVTNFRSLPYADAPAFMARLAMQDGIAALALRFLMLTASSTGEVLGATRTEFDLDRREWRIDGRRVKVGGEHVVYLSDAALAIVRERQRGALATEVSRYACRGSASATAAAADHIANDRSLAGLSHAHNALVAVIAFASRLK